MTLRDDLATARPLVWFNPHRQKTAEALMSLNFTIDDIYEAQAKFRRWEGLMAKLFQLDSGLIQSPLTTLDIPERSVLAKRDCDLPVTGSVKTRGGFYEVLCHAESLALEAGLMRHGDDPLVLASPEARQLFSHFGIAVGSTGNLGLSVGSIGAALGFSTTVYMSADAKEWKKQLLRTRGASVVEHQGSYSDAVTLGRIQAQNNGALYFVDDEQSPLLFTGYSAAAPEVVQQLMDLNCLPTEEQPLKVFLPCGVGGAPSGIAFGLSALLGDTVELWLVEPVQHSCLLYSLLEDDPSVCVTSLGLGNATEADGLAVSKASPLAWRVCKSLVTGVITLDDQSMLNWIPRLRRQGIKAEPSAASSGAAMEALGGDDPALLWLTGGSLVPDKETTLLPP